MRYELDDVYNEDLPKQIVDVDQGDPSGVFVFFPGYGDYCSADGSGCLACIEYRDGIPHIIIWANINREDPTRTISLKGAALSRRQNEE